MRDLEPRGSAWIRCRANCRAAHTSVRVEARGCLPGVPRYRGGADVVGVQRRSLLGGPHRCSAGTSGSPRGPGTRGVYARRTETRHHETTTAVDHATIDACTLRLA